VLYITTRNDKDFYTAHRALHEGAAPDGGAYVPFKLPTYSAYELKDLFSGGFGQTVANILNLFFSCRLTGWDVDFAIGRNPVKLATMSHRIVVAELWHNPDGNYDYITNALYNKICNTTSETPSEWFALASHISVLFGLYGVMCRTGVIAPNDPIDISTTIERPFIPLAAVYAKIMGLPVGELIITCEENSGIWDLIHLGEIASTAGFAKSVGCERLVDTTLGKPAVYQMREALHNCKTYRVDKEQLCLLNSGIFCAVTGAHRTAQHINSIYRSNAYVLDPTSALCVGGLQDYRAKTGESKLTLVHSCASPVMFYSEISQATGITKDKLTALLKNPQDGRM
jgi:hypothetical protein